MTDVITAYIGIGSNVGDREENCRTAAALLKEAGAVTAVSSLYETEPMGLKGQADFINAVVAVETGLPPEELLRTCRSIEDRLGRKREVRWGPRTIDLDILLYGDAVIGRPELTVPHPRMAERLFVLLPLAEIAPAKAHPLLGKTMQQLSAEVKDPQRVVRRGPAPVLP